MERPTKVLLEVEVTTQERITKIFSDEIQASLESESVSESITATTVSASLDSRVSTESEQRYQPGESLQVSSVAESPGSVLLLQQLWECGEDHKVERPGGCQLCGGQSPGGHSPGRK